MKKIINIIGIAIFSWEMLSILEFFASEGFFGDGVLSWWNMIRFFM